MWGMPVARPSLVGCGAGELDVPGDAGAVDGGGEVFVVDDGVVPPTQQGVVGNV